MPTRQNLSKIAGLRSRKRRGLLATPGDRPKLAYLRAALYARVSTEEQQTLAMQLATLGKHARQRGWVIAAEIEEVGSGALRRPKREP